MIGSNLAATQGTILEEAAPGPVSLLGCGQAHNQRAIVSEEYIMMFHYNAWMLTTIHNN